LDLNVAEILHRCRLFAKVEERGFQRLVVMARLCRFDKGQAIFREGGECPGVYVVGSGLIRVFKTAASGKEHVLHMVGPGRTFAEVAAIGGFPCPANAEAVVPSLCALLQLAPFKKALDEDHELCMGMMVGLATWAHQLVELLEDVVLRDAIGRLARYLLDAKTGPEGLVELPTLKRHVASHLNLTSETLSRTIRRLVEAGLIEELDANRVRLVHRQRLGRVAEGMVSDI
jgi:CRP/FNR family transcriptional regulator